MAEIKLDKKSMELVNEFREARTIVENAEGGTLTWRTPEWMAANPDVKGRKPSIEEAVNYCMSYFAPARFHATEKYRLKQIKEAKAERRAAKAKEKAKPAKKAKAKAAAPKKEKPAPKAKAAPKEKPAKAAKPRAPKKAKSNGAAESSAAAPPAETQPTAEA